MVERCTGAARELLQGASRRGGGGGDRNLDPAAASWSRTVTTNDRWIASDLMVRQAPMSSNVSYGQPPMSGSMAPNIISPMASMGNDMFEAYKQPFGRKF